MITHLSPNPLIRRCVDCPTTPPVCGCSADQQCVLITKSCDVCAYYECQSTSSSKSSKGVSGGAVAGAVIGSVILLTLVVLLYLWNRKRTRAAAAAKAEGSPKDVPASALDVLNRPDPNEKAQQEAHQQEAQQQTYTLYPAAQAQAHASRDPEAQLTSAGTGDARPPPMRRDTAQSNPFSDTHSIQTMSTGSQSTNVIPIALAPRTPPADADGPLRPVRTPDLSLNMDHLAMSDGAPSYTASERSGADAPAPAGARNSYMSGLTTVTDILAEAPRIVTPVRTVLHTGKAEVVMRTPATSAPGSPDSLRAPAPPARGTRSPLASSAFGPGDVLHEDAAGEAATTHDPFRDASALPRPASGLTLATNAGTIVADIAEATRVQVGVPVVPGARGGTLQRVASGRLVTPRSRNTSTTSGSPTGTSATSATGGTLQEQQARALAFAQLRAREQGPAGATASRRMSDASVSTRADSILEGFPFVPPSPISDRPARAARSPLAQGVLASHADVPAPPSRATLGLSTGSQLSTASSGLGAFAFTIEGAPPAPASALPHSAVPPPSAAAAAPPSAFARQQGQPASAPAPTSAPGPQRASLDTLALTADLASYPLGFDPARAPPLPSGRP